MSWPDGESSDASDLPFTGGGSGIRLVDVADELGMTTADVLDLCETVGIDAQSGADEVTASEVEQLRRARGGEPDGDAEVAPGALGGWVGGAGEPAGGEDGPSWAVSGNAAPNSGAGTAPLLGAPTPSQSASAAGIGMGPPSKAPKGFVAKPERGAKKAHVHPYAYLALAFAFLPVLKIIIKFPVKMPPIGGSVISTFITLLLMAPAWGFAEAAEDRIHDEPDRWSGEMMCLWAKALATLFLFVALVYGFYRVFAGIGGI